MLIDWFTVAAQTLNFLILVWLMKRFLYQPILRAIDAREKKIADELADAAGQVTAAKQESKEFQLKNAEFDQQRADLLAKATDEAKAVYKRLLNDARAAADEFAAKRRESLLNDAKNLNQSITRKVQDEVIAISRQVIIDLSGAILEDQIVRVFIDRLYTLDETTKLQLRDVLISTKDPALIRSACELTDEPRAAIQSAINQTFSADIQLRFETAPDLVGGIELTASGRKISWSINDYLKSLQAGVGELLKAGST